MKTFVLLACLLVATYAAAVYPPGALFFEYLTACEKELPKVLNIPVDLRPELIYCSLMKDDVIDKQGKMDKNEAVEKCQFYTTNPLLQQICRVILAGCIDKGHQGQGTDSEKSIKSIHCAIRNGVMGIFGRT